MFERIFAWSNTKYFFGSCFSPPKQPVFFFSFSICIKWKYHRELNHCGSIIYFSYLSIPFLCHFWTRALEVMLFPYCWVKFSTFFNGGHYTWLTNSSQTSHVSWNRSLWVIHPNRIKKKKRKKRQRRGFGFQEPQFQLRKGAGFDVQWS